MPKPFTIDSPEATLTDLRERLQRTRWPDQLDAYGWEQGSELGYTQALARYWAEDYDWRRHEAEINRYDHFMATIDGQPLHFIHQRSPHANARPLLIQHGWPGSFYEFHQIIPMLTHPEQHGGRPEDAFHVVAPSLPGYVFSPPPQAPGMTTRAMGSVMHGLMRALGYTRFCTQGGDWGAMVTSWLAFDHPDAIIGVHLNMQGLRARIGESPLSEAEQAYVSHTRGLPQSVTPHFVIQGAHPQSIGYGLMDSPAGLLGWLVQKFRAWTDCDGELKNAISWDTLLTNVTLYWITGCITSSARLYYEHSHAEDAVLPRQRRIESPTGFAHFPGEIFHPPRHWVERAYNLVHWTEMPKGGHFAAMEQPARLAEDVRTFFAALE